MNTLYLTFAAVVLSPLCAWAGARSSASYSIPAETFDAGGAAAASATYQEIGSAGSILGRSTATNVELRQGYIPQIEVGPLQILSAVSRKAHGTVGTFDLNLPLTGPAGVESRNSGANGSFQLVLNFDTTVSVSGVSVMSADGQAAGSASVNQSVVTLNLTGVSNAQTVGVTLVQVNNGAETGNLFVPLSILLGDANGDGFVNSADAAITRGRSGQQTDMNNFRADYNLDGMVNSGDAAITRSRSGQSLP